MLCFTNWNSYLSKIAQKMLGNKNENYFFKIVSPFFMYLVPRKKFVDCFFLIKSLLKCSESFIYNLIHYKVVI